MFRYKLNKEDSEKSLFIKVIASNTSTLQPMQMENISLGNLIIGLRHANIKEKSQQLKMYIFIRVLNSCTYIKGDQ